MTGRPSKITVERVETLIDATALGATRLIAANAAGISKRTFMEWLSKGRRGEGRLETLLAEGIRVADGQIVMDCLRGIREAGKQPKHWTALAWIAERRFPGEYGRIDRSKVIADEHLGEMSPALSDFAEMDDDTDKREAFDQVMGW